METFKVEGVVLQTTDFGDANRVVTLFTKEFGKLELNAYGCRRSKSPLSGAVQMFNHISADLSQGTKVDTIRDADVLHFYANLTADIERLSYAALFFELVNRMTLPKMPELGIFNLLLRSLDALNERNPQIAALISSSQFLNLSGVQLSFGKCVHCGKKIVGDAGMSFIDGGAICEDCAELSEEIFNYPEFLRSALEKISAFDWREETRLTLKPRQIRAAEEFFLHYIRFILGKELNSAKFLRQLHDI